jgi:hypothetical protein
VSRADDLRSGASNPDDEQLSPAEARKLANRIADEPATARTDSSLVGRIDRDDDDESLSQAEVDRIADRVAGRGW